MARSSARSAEGNGSGRRPVHRDPSTGDGGRSPRRSSRSQPHGYSPGSRHPDGRMQPAPSNHWSCSARAFATRPGRCPDRRHRTGLPGAGASQQGRAVISHRSPVGSNQWRLHWLTLAFAAQDGALTLAALFRQPQVERLLGGELGHRHHEVAPRIAHQAFDIPFVVALAWPAIAIPDQVV